MAQANATRDDAPFKRPVYAVESCITDEAGKLIFVLCHPRGMKAQLNDDELEAAAELTATAINAYSPERDKAVQGLVEALKQVADHEATPYLISVHARAALAAYEASK